MKNDKPACEATEGEREETRWRKRNIKKKDNEDTEQLKDGTKKARRREQKAKKENT